MKKDVENNHENTNQHTVFNELIEPVDGFVNNQNEQLPKHSNQKFNYYNFFRILIYYFVSEASSLKLLINNQIKKGLLPAELQLPYVPYSTFNDAFERFPPNLFQDVFYHLLSSLKFKEIPELATLGVLYCIDGSLFPVISSMAWAEYTSKHNALKIHMCLELNRMLAIDFQIGSGNSSERNALRNMLKAGVTYIADRGYMAFNLFSDIVRKKAHFVFRVKDNLVYNTLESLDISIPVAAHAFLENVTDTLIRYSNDPSGNIYRQVRFQAGKEIFSILTDRRDITTFQVIMLYGYRWQIELMFRFLKRTMQGIHLIKHDERGVTIQFYALLITALLELHLKQSVMETAEAEENNKDTEEMAAESAGLDEKGGKKAAEAAVSAAEPDESSKKCISSGSEFIEIIGKTFDNYWKIGIYWLDSLRNLLASPFDEWAIKTLGYP